MITVYALVQLLIDLFMNKVDERFVMSISIALFSVFSSHGLSRMQRRPLRPSLLFSA